MATASVQQIVSAVRKKFPEIQTVGVDDCRLITDSTAWSQHSWGNAADFMVGTNMALGDRIYAYLLGQKVVLPMGTICWRSFGGCTTYHGDHVHVDGSPKQRGVPPCAGGPANPRAARDANQVPVANGGFATPELEDFFNQTAGGGFLGETKFGSTLDLINALGRPDTWLRVLWFVAGLGLGFVGLSAILKEFNVSIPLPGPAGVAQLVAKAAA